MSSLGEIHDANRADKTVSSDKEHDAGKIDEGRSAELLPSTREAAEADDVVQVRSQLGTSPPTGQNTARNTNTDEDIYKPNPDSLRSATVGVENSEGSHVNLRVTELERKIIKLKSIQKQLVEANSEWEKHCETLTRQNDEQVKALTDELHDKKKYIKDLQQAHSQSEKRVHELKQTLNTKQEECLNHQEQLEQLHEQLAEREASYQSLLERGDTRGGHENLMESRVQELERQVKQLTHSPANPVTHQRPSEARAPPAGHQQLGTRLRPDATAAELRTHIAVLQAQVSAFKEDFDHERADKERTEAARTTLQHRLENREREVDELKRLAEQKDRESAAVKNQNEYVRQQYTQKCRELESERTRIADLRAELSRMKERPGRDEHVCTTSPRHVHPRVDVWRCSSCTYENVHPRVTCEMCGQKAPHAAAGHLTTDKPRLLARHMEQSDTPARGHRFYMHDVVEDTQCLSDVY